MTYTYNLSGALVEQMYPSGRVVKNVLDADGDLSMVQSKKNAGSGYFNYAKNFTYTAAGAVSSMQLGNGKWESTSFNSRLQPTQIALGTVQGGTDKLKLDYEYGKLNWDGTVLAGTNNGNVAKQTITVPTVGSAAGFTAVQYYAYDELSRIQTASENFTQNGQSTVTSWTQGFVYDRYGNRRFDTANTTTLPQNCATAVCNPTIDPATNRLVGYTFDTAGNTKVDATGRTFTYDAENKQTEVKNANNIIVGEYFYDGDGKRVKKVVPGTGETTIFVYDASGKMVAEYSTVTNNNPQISYLTSDHLGSPRVNTDASGTVTARHDYMPFGEEIQRASYGSDSVREQFATYERDKETDLDFAQARMHNFNYGRFTSVDPIMMTKKRLADPQSINLYVYARNNPLRFVDPNGEEFKGTDGKKVIIENVNGDWVIRGDNASIDLRRLVNLINNSGSSTANRQFQRLNDHKTKINFAFSSEKLGNYGKHQPYGIRTKDGKYGALPFNEGTGKFEGTAALAKDADGKDIEGVYAEADITIYDEVYRSELGATEDSVNEGILGTFGHEAEHDLDPEQVQETINKTYSNSVYHPTNPDGTDAKGSPGWIKQQIINEVKEFKNKPRCPRGHMCY